VEYVKGAGSKAYGAEASVLLRRDKSRVLEYSQVLHERRQRHLERCGELGDDGRGLCQPFHDSTTCRIRDSAEHGVELVMIVRHKPNYHGVAGARQPVTLRTDRYVRPRPTANAQQRRSF
jgi:hypothetical protein